MIKKRSCDRPLFYLNEKSYRIFPFSYPGKENKNYIPYLCEDIIEHRPPMKANGNIDLSTACYGEVKQNAYSLAILPWGATEPHNQHLPYLTDCILSHEIALDTAQQVWRSQQIRCMVLPPVFMGSQNPGQRDLPFCIHSRYETQKAILTDIVASLHYQGLCKLVIINGHGGNNFKNMIRDLAVDYPDFLIASTEWFTIVPPNNFFEEKDDHAGELETSVMLHYHPEQVNMPLAGTGNSHPFSLPSLNEKIAWIPRNWQRVTTDTGIGDPRKANAEKGKCYVEAVTKKLGQLFIELAQTEDIYDKVLPKEKV